MIENKFLYFKTYQDFKAKLDAGNISEGSIVFIDDKSIIWTHGKEFMCSLPVSDEFGDSTQTSVSQKALSDAFNRVWTKLEDITGESLTGISMSVTPEYFIGDNGCTVSIRVNSVRANGIFESVKFYINNELVKEFDTVELAGPFDIHIDGTCTLKCEAKIMGVTYTAVKEIINYPAFWMGAGSEYADVMTNENLVDISQGMRTAKDIVFNDGDYLFVIMGNSLLKDFIRVDMNGFEIPLSAAAQIPGGEYTYFVSKNSFGEGVYNIDING